MFYLLRTNLIVNSKHLAQKSIIIRLTRLNSSVNNTDFDFSKKRSSTKVRNNIPPPIDLKSVRTHEQTKDSENERDERTRINLAGLALLSIPILTFGLGCWQIKRREWKMNLISYLNDRTKQEPRELPTDPTELEHLVENFEYCPFKIKGHFLHSKEILISPKHDITLTSNLPGGLVVTPFVLSKNPKMTILVNRGFVPYMRYSPVTRKEAQVEDEIELIGLLRGNEIINSFTPDNKPPNEWHFRDINRMAQCLDTAPIFLDAVEDSTLKGGPIGGQTAINIRNEHMTYLITWFSLSLITSIMWIRKFVLRK